MIKILFVCLGNICRSPLAEGIFSKLINEKGLEDEITCDSAGTSGWHIGEPPDKRSVFIANKHNIELDHFGRQLEPEDFQTFDYIIAMDKSNFNHIKAVSGYENFGEENLFLMRKFDDFQPDTDVPDPYFGGDEGFENVYQMLERSSKHFLHYLIEKHEL